MRHILKIAALTGGLGFGYIILVSSFLFYVPKHFEGPDTVLIPIMMLSLFVFSAGLMGFLIFGRPIMWYWDGKKREALLLLLSTLAALFTILLVVFGIFLAA